MNNPDTDAALEAQQTLAESALELVSQIYRDALDDGVATPLVVLVDCEDELGGQIARGWLGDETVEDAIAMAHEDDQEEAPETTVFARALAWNDAAAELCEAFPYLAPALQSPPEDEGIFIVSITAGGASALTAPLE